MAPTTILWVCIKLLQLCLTLCDSRDGSTSGSSVQRFFRQEYWSGFPHPPPGGFPDSGIELSLLSPALAGGFFTTSTTWEALLLFHIQHFLYYSISYVKYFLLNCLLLHQLSNIIYYIPSSWGYTEAGELFFFLSSHSNSTFTPFFPFLRFHLLMNPRQSYFHSYYAANH